jgi:hypothetical protein
LGPALLSLAGVVLGAGGSLFGQYLVSRASTRQLEIQESAAHRAELKNVILKFLSIASQVEKAAPTPQQAGGSAAGSAIGQLVDDLWLAHAEIDLSARSEHLRGAAYRYAARLAEAGRGEMTDASELRRSQVQFFDAAYDDMWPGQRRAAGVFRTPS